jgi:hypothetical protein
MKRFMQVILGINIAILVVVDEIGPLFQIGPNARIAAAEPIMFRQYAAVALAYAIVLLFFRLAPIRARARLAALPGNRLDRLVVRRGLRIGRWFRPGLGEPSAGGHPGDPRRLLPVRVFQTAQPGSRSGSDHN